MVSTAYLLAGAVVAGFAAGVVAGFVAAGFGVAAALAAGFAAVLAFADVVLAFVGAAGVLVFVIAGVDDDAPAGRAPLSSLGLSTTFLARKFSILASFIAIA